MNNSSVIFVGGFTLVFGFFAAQSFNADARALRTADARAAQLQADLIAESGVNLAAYYLATPSQSDGLNVTTSANGGTLSYTLTNISDGLFEVVSKGRIGTVEVTKRARLQRGASGQQQTNPWYQWQIKTIWTAPYSLSDVIVE